MKIYSYTNAAFPVPVIIDNKWPVPYLEGYSHFIKNFVGAEVYLIQQETTNTWVPLQVKKNSIFKFGQLLFAPVSNAKEVEPELQQQFFEELIPILKLNALCQRLQQPHPMGISFGVPAGVNSCRFGTYVNALQNSTDEALLYSFDPKYRKAVQHSIKNGGRVEFGPQVLDDFYKLYSATMHRAGIYTDSSEFFKAQLSALPSNTDIGIVYDENGPVGGIFLLWSEYSALCTHAGSGGESKLYGAMKHLHYAMMLRMKQRGVYWYDLVGVRLNSHHPTLQGVFRFKKGFGGILREGYLWKTDISPIPMKIFDTLLLIRQRGAKSHGDIIDQEKNNSESNIKNEEPTSSTEE